MKQKTEEILVKNLGRIFFILMISIYFTVAGDEIKIEKVKKKESDIEFKIFSNKKEAFIGEPIIVTLRLKIKKSLEIVDYRFSPPVFNDFWVKRVDEESSGKYLLDTPKYLVKELKYVVFPQKSGVLKIEPAIIKIATPDTTQDLFGVVVTVPKWREVKSNVIDVVVKPLPKDLSLIGDFKIKAYVDKNEIEKNEPVNLTVEITGSGNMENFEGIDLNITEATVFKDHPKKIERFKQDEIKVKFIQKFSIVSDKSFTIPPIKIEYFDPKKSKIFEISTNAIKIKKKDSRKNNEEEAYTTTKNKSLNKNQDFDFYIFLLGFVSGVIITFFIFFILRKHNKKSYRFLRFKTQKKELLNRLLPHIDKSKRVEDIAQALYEDIYFGKKFHIDKKEINNVLKEIKDSK